MPAPKVSLQPSLQVRDLVGLLISLVIGLCAAYWPFYLDRRFYFNDDEQTWSYPYFIEIGRCLHHGTWPFLSLMTLNGGNLILDWQTALFNPVSLLSYWVISPMTDLCTVGLSLATFYISILSIGGYLLGRSFGIGRALSVVASTVLCTNNFTSFIYGNSWMPGLVASSWFVWAWCLIQMFRSTGSSYYLIGAVTFCYLELSAGWPHGIIMLGVLVFSYLIEMILDLRCPRFRPPTLLMSFTGVAMLLAPAFLPVIFSASWTDRHMHFSSQGLFMANLGDFLNLSTFDLTPRMTVFNSSSCAIPVMYLSWFIIPLIPFLRWNSVIESLSHRWALGLGGGLGMILLFSPQSIGPLRWPIRFLPLPHIVILISFLLLINNPHIFVITVRRCLVCAAVIALSFTSSTSVAPENLQLHLFAASFLGFLTWIAIELIRVSAFRSLALWLVFGVLLGYVGTHCSFKNPFFPDFGSSSQVRASVSSSNQVFDGYTLCLSGDFNSSQTDWSNEAFLAAQSILTGEPTVNGYTSVGHRTFNRNFLCGIRTNITSSQGIANLFSTDATTGETVADLLRLNTLIIEKKTALPVARSYLGSAWKLVSTGRYTVRYERVYPDLNPTTVAWSSPGTTALPLGVPTGENETVRVSAGSGANNLIFARLWWPGYSATLNGTPIEAKPFSDLLVSVQIPSEAQGILSLTYTPPGYHFGVIVALLGLTIITVMVLLNPRLESKGDS